jgi:hypothetical protein
LLKVIFTSFDLDPIITSMSYSFAISAFRDILSELNIDSGDVNEALLSRGVCPQCYEQLTSADDEYEECFRCGRNDGTEENEEPEE